MTRLFYFGFVRSLPFSGSLLSLWLSRSVSPAFVRGDFCPKDITHLAHVRAWPKSLTEFLYMPLMMMERSL